MILPCIFKRYHNEYNSPLNILTTQCENKRFEKFLKKTLANDSHIFKIEDALFANTTPDIIICHNKINYLDKCGAISYFFHCPILIIDHEYKPSFIDKNIIEYQSSSVFSVALNEGISKSWGSVHNIILDFDINNEHNIEQWRNLLYQISKIPFNLKAKKYNEEKE